ncbi:MAG: triose-phosphate isomerase [Candidatus Sungbacteria bacterium]|uniref:Triosephosphate isomerase n=1 Tax=Candidatus Sungiibacteriota bacterium TaxID=2750080 RepID=A0A9D6QU09_9BACT|nr:triose-phosphate isomerase [Candidatus Sungbacteria bacterium]
MKKYLAVANWKMNPGTEGEALDLFSTTLNAAKSARNVEVVVCPPFPFLSAIERRWGIHDLEMRSEAAVHLGAQDLFWERDGAYTGEVSGPMEKELGVSYVIIGHSERRRLLGETDEMVNKKLQRAFETGLHPILCIGEKERMGDDIPEIVGDQLKKATQGISGMFIESLVVAYEPVWAIGTGKPDTPESMHKAAIYIRKVLAEMHGEGSVSHARVLYGGSITSTNVASFIRETSGEVQGVLVGGASLKDDFAKIISSLEEIES